MDWTSFWMEMIFVDSATLPFSTNVYVGEKITCLLKANNCSLEVKGWKINGMDVSLKYHLSGSDLIHFMCVSGKYSAFRLQKNII